MPASATRCLVLVCMALLCASGCSLKMMYNNADRLARWMANDYIRMDEAQEAYFDAEVDALLYWHRSEELPRYADFLEALPAQLADGATEAEVQAVFDELFGWYEALEARAMPLLTEMLLSLSDEQVAGLPRRLEKDNERFSKDERDQPLEEIQEEWMGSYVDTVSRFSGRLDKDQKAYLGRQSVRYIPQFGLWADYRRRWQADLLELIATGRDDPDRFAAALRTLVESRESYYGDELAAIFERNERLVLEVTAWLWSNLSAEQQERMATRLLEMATLFRELAEDLPETAPQGGGCLVRC